MLWTLAWTLVVICLRCTSLTRPLGCSTNTSMLGKPPSAAMAAEPVSPLVAATMVACRPACQGAGEQPPQHLQGNILKGEGGAVEQLQQIALPFERDRTSGAIGGRIETPVGRGDVASRVRRRKRGRQSATGLIGHFLIGLALKGGDLGRAELRPGLRHIQAAIRRQAGQQHFGKIGGRAPGPGWK